MPELLKGRREFPAGGRLHREFPVCVYRVPRLRLTGTRGSKLPRKKKQLQDWKKGVGIWAAVP